MARAARQAAPQIINERDPGGDDDDDAGAGNAPVREVIPEIQNLRTPETPTFRQPRQAKDETDYVVVETDANGRPIKGGAPADEDEEALADMGGDSLVDQRRRAREMADGDGEEGPDADGNWPNHKSRRQKRREGKERMFEENKRLNGEVEELRTQLDNFRSVVEPRLSEIDSARGREQLANLDLQIATATQEAERAEKAVALAIREGDEEAVVKAMRADKTAFLKQQQLISAKATLSQRLQGAGDGARQPVGDEGADQRRAAPQRRVAPDPVIKSRADEFLSAHPWIQANKKPRDQDPDTRLALYIDEEVRREGFDARTDDYWDELEDRLRRRFPEHFEQPRRRAANGNGAGDGERRQPAAQPNNARRGPPVVGAGESRGGGRREVRISPERRQAMIDQGTVAIDGTIIDQVKFKRTLAKYDEYDRANPAR